MYTCRKTNETVVDIGVTDVTGVVPRDDSYNYVAVSVSRSVSGVPTTTREPPWTLQWILPSVRQVWHPRGAGSGRVSVITVGIEEWWVVRGKSKFVPESKEPELQE